MTTYYLIRRGWNSANQSSRGSRANPRNTFESHLDSLVAIVEAESAAAAVAAYSGTVYHNQFVRAVSNPRSVKGLTQAIRDYQG